MRKPFQFKQFRIQDENSAMKVGTDAVLLGAWIKPENFKTILDIGTGSGLIALMMAQRTNAQIEAIDIDLDSIQEASNNFMISPWSDNLFAIHSSLFDHLIQSKKKYDLVLSNPPYFSNSLKSPSDRKNLSKHTSTLSHKDLISGVKKLISPEGTFALIIPFDQMSSFINLALMEGLYCNTKLIIYPTPDKQANRIIMEFRLNRDIHLKEEKLTIRDEFGIFTEQYKILTKNFYLDL